MRCSTLGDTFSSLITLATPRQDRTGSNPREGGGCGFTLKVAQLLRGAACYKKSVPVIFEPPCTSQLAEAAMSVHVLSVFTPTLRSENLRVRVR